LDKSQKRLGKSFNTKQSSLSSKPDSKPTFSPSDMWKACQIREHRRENGLCFKCGDKYAPGHKCPDTACEASMAQLAAMTGNNGDGGGLLSEEILSALEMHSITTKDDRFLSLNAISGTQNNKMIHLRALLNNQVLPILVDSGSSHTFLNATMLHKLDCKVISVSRMTVKVANGDTIFF
jgi:hypothetical protein